MTGNISRKKFEEEFLTFRPQLRSYLLRISGNPDDAEDISQDAFLKALKNLDKFLGKSSLKTWVFTIATNLVRDHQRSESRWSVNCQDNARADTLKHPEKIQRMRERSSKSPAGKYVLKEHVDFCFTCIGKTLSIEQQIVLILKDIYDFTVSEIMEIAQLTEGKVKHSLADGRKTMIRIFNNKCALVSKKGVCYQCSELNDIFNPTQNAQSEIQKLKMKQAFDKGESKEELYKLRTELVKAIDPYESEGSDLHSFFLKVMPHYS